MKDTIDMAREAGADIGTSARWLMTQSELDRLVNLVRADERSVEREACAEVCDDYDVKYDVCSSDTAESIAQQIRARENT
jgi:hypothetical protein